MGWLLCFKNFVLVGTDDGESGYDSQTSNLLCFNPKPENCWTKNPGSMVISEVMWPMIKLQIGIILHLRAELLLCKSLCCRQNQ